VRGSRSTKFIQANVEIEARRNGEVAVRPGVLLVLP